MYRNSSPELVVEIQKALILIRSISIQIDADKNISPKQIARYLNKGLVLAV